jgi:hypothetical protein
MIYEKSDELTYEIGINTEEKEWWWIHNYDRDSYWRYFQTDEDNDLGEPNYDWKYHEQVEENVSRTITSIIHKKLHVSLMDSSEQPGEYEEL